MLIVFSYRVIYLFCLYSLWQLKEVDRVTYEEMNNITMKTVSVFYLICVFIVLFASSSDAVRSQPDAELKVVHITLYSYSRKEDGAVSLTFLVWVDQTQNNEESGNRNSIPSFLLGLGRGSDWRENSRMTSTSSKGRGLSSLVDKLQNYISSYTSSTASWLTYPYFGISTGVTSIIVIFVVIYILILGQLQHYHSFLHNEVT